MAHSEFRELARTMKYLVTLLILGCCLAALPQANSQRIVYNFTSSLDPLVSVHDRFTWGDRSTIPWWLPEDGSDGFAFHYIPKYNGIEGDTLYDQAVDVQFGFTYEIKFFLASRLPQGSTLEIQRVDSTGANIETVADFRSESSPSNTDWFTKTGTVAASGVPSNFAVFCQLDMINPLYDTLSGCAIDYIIINVVEPPPPTEVIDWTFESGTGGWTLGTSNGASWIRTLYNSTATIFPPTGGDAVLQVVPTDVYSGTVLATSPRLRIGDTGIVKVTVDFFIDVVDISYPSYLKLRRRLSYTTYNDDVAVNMDAYGNQVNQHWLSVTETFTGLVPGEEFNAVLEGNLGIANLRNNIFVSRIYMEGVSEVPYDEAQIFDFKDGLIGWNSGSVDGGKFVLEAYSDIFEELDMPRPLSENVLVARRFDLHSGVITIEGPPIAISPQSAKQLNIRFWVRGSPRFPVVFRIGLKNVEGKYDPLPFYNLAEFGDADHQTWLSLGSFVPIPVSPREDFFQLVFEVDLGGSNDNQFAIDQFEIKTV